MVLDSVCIFVCDTCAFGKIWSLNSEHHRQIRGAEKIIFKCTQFNKYAKAIYDCIRKFLASNFIMTWSRVYLDVQNEIHAPGMEK